MNLYNLSFIYNFIQKSFFLFDYYKRQDYLQAKVVTANRRLEKNDKPPVLLSIQSAVWLTS